MHAVSDGAVATQPTRYEADEIARLEDRIAELEQALVFLARVSMGARGSVVVGRLRLLGRYGFPLKDHWPPGRRRNGVPLGSTEEQPKNRRQ